MFVPLPYHTNFNNALVVQNEEGLWVRHWIESNLTQGSRHCKSFLRRETWRWSDVEQGPWYPCVLLGKDNLGKVGVKILFERSEEAFEDYSKDIDMPFTLYLNEKQKEFLGFEQEKFEVKKEWKDNLLTGFSSSLLLVTVNRAIPFVKNILEILNTQINNERFAELGENLTISVRVTEGGPYLSIKSWNQLLGLYKFYKLEPVQNPAKPVFEGYLLDETKTILSLPIEEKKKAEYVPMPKKEVLVIRKGDFVTFTVRGEEWSGYITKYLSNAEIHIDNSSFIINKDQITKVG